MVMRHFGGAVGHTDRVKLRDDPVSEDEDLEEPARSSYGYVQPSEDNAAISVAALNPGTTQPAMTPVEALAVAPSSGEGNGMANEEEDDRVESDDEREINSESEKDFGDEEEFADDEEEGEGSEGEEGDIDDDL
jgi:hypothetical protein